MSGPGPGISRPDRSGETGSGTAETGAAATGAADSGTAETGTNRGPRWPVAVVGLVALVVGVLALLRDWPVLVLGIGVTLALLAAGLVVAIRLDELDGSMEHARERVVRPDPLGGLVEKLRQRRFARRVFLGGGAAAALGALGLLEWLGPERVEGTSWGPGARLVTSDGAPIRPDDVPPGSVATVWPEGNIGDGRSSVMLLRLSGIQPVPPTILEWVVDGTLLAYSRICTHAGCPVALFRESDASMFCPCHQATFATDRGATVTFGPASRPLPQLPLGVGDDGFLVALEDFRSPVGPVPTSEERR